MKRLNAAVCLLCAAALFLMESCSYRVASNPFFDEESAPARPCLISSDTTMLVVRDYFPTIGRVDALRCDDYRIVPVSGESMDTVLVVCKARSRSISTVKVTTGDESGVIVLKRENPEVADTPVISAVGSGMGGREFTVEVKNTPASYLVLWQNTLLDRNCLSYRKNGVFTVHIPYNALEMERSYIRIYSHNAAGAGSDMAVPVVNGRILNKNKSI